MKSIGCTIKRFFAISLALLLVFGVVPPTPVSAENYNVSFGTTYYGFLTATNNSDVYSITLTQTGRLTINITSPSGDGIANYGARVRWLDSNGIMIRDHNGFNFSYNNWVDLEAGTYTVEISSRSASYTGAYLFVATFNAAGNNETEPNNTRETAQLLSSGQAVTGFISHQDNTDVFRYVLAQAGRLTVNITSPSGFGIANYGARVRWLDANGILIRDDNGFGFSYNNWFDLEAGTYFIEISSRNNNTGIYTIMGAFNAAGNNETEPNNTRETAQLLTSGQAVTGFISHQDSTDIFKYVLPQAGRLTVNITSPSGFGIVNYGARVRWLDANGILIRDHNGFSFSYNNWEDLEAGTYYVEVLSRNNGTGIYNFAGTFNAAGNNETEPNNTRETAQLLALGQSVTGFISNQDTIDIYRFILPQAARVTVNMTSPSGFGLANYNARVRWLDVNGILLRDDNGFNFPYSNWRDLEAGTYYLEVVSRNNGTGIYNLTIQDPTDLPRINLSASPANGGTVTGGGPFQSGSTVTLSATANAGFTFDGWYENNTRVNTNATWSFTATTTRTIEARFVSAVWSLDPTSILYPVAAPGYSTQAAQQVTIRNTGTAALTGVSASITSGSSGFEIVTSPPSSIPAGGQGSISIRPRTGLADGTYTGVLTVTATGGATQTVSLSFRVEAQVTIHIPEQHSGWATPELTRAAELGMIPPVLMAPSIDLTRPITRVEFAGIAVRTYESLTGTIIPPVSNNPFYDTSDPDALRAASIGLMVGFEGAFDPHSILTREMLATALSRVYKSTTMPGWTFANDAMFPLHFTMPSPFADDADISSWAREGVYFMASRGIIQGMGSNMFRPRSMTATDVATEIALATREQAVVLAYRAANELRVP